VEYPRLHSRFLFPFTNKKLFDFFFKEWFDLIVFNVKFYIMKHELVQN
jgi:hypothetical protein